LSFAGKWTESEVIMLSEISQTQKSKYAESRPKFIITKSNINVKGELIDEFHCNISTLAYNIL
jgi:hypothetical protein